MSDRDTNLTSIMGELLASLMFEAHRTNRGFLYIWETRAARVLIEAMDAGKSVGSDWTATFLKLNREAIMTGGTNPKISFNLRAFEEAPPQA